MHPMTGARVETPARCTVRGGVAFVSGDLDIATVPALESWLLTRGAVEIIDLRDVTFFGSAALRMLLNAQRRNPSLRVVHPSHPVARVLNLCGIADHLSGLHP